MLLESPNAVKATHIWKQSLKKNISRANSQVAITTLTRFSSPRMRHPRCPSTHMDVSRLCNVMTHLNRLNPSMSHHILNCWPISRIGFQHLANEATTSSGIEVINCRRAWRHSLIWAGASCNISRVELVSCWLRCAPWKFLKVQAVIDYPACPDIYQSRIIGYRHRRKTGSRIFWREKNFEMQQ